MTDAKTKRETLLRDAVKLAVEMRKAQREYYKTPRDTIMKRRALEKARGLEHQFDAYAKSALDALQGLDF